MKRAQAGWVENGRRMQRAMGLATLRLDGFVSLDASDEGGMMTTRPPEVTGEVLKINDRARDRHALVNFRHESLVGQGRALVTGPILPGRQLDRLRR